MLHDLRLRSIQIRSRSLKKISSVTMAMQWLERANNRAHRPVKFSIGRCITLSTFTVFVFLLYLRMAVDRIPIQSPDVVPAVIQASEQVESSRSPTSSTEPETPISESDSDILDEIIVKPAISELPDKEATFETSDAAVTSEATSASFQRAENCDGRRIFIYDMPVEFNEQLARNCHNCTDWRTMCEDISNFGFGVNIPLRKSDPMSRILQPPSAWYRTDQFTLEVAIHERLKTHPCLTTNPDETSLFYIPFYHALDLIRTLYHEHVSARDLLGQKMVKWLTAQAPWQRLQGHRHVLVLGRIYWDFIRGLGLDSAWGSNLLTLPELENVTKLFIERSPWKSDTVGIPYPTSFHPASEADLRAWQRTVRTSRRRQFASVAGGTRSKKLTGSIRDEVFSQCANSTKCRQVSCNHEVCIAKPQTIIRMSLESVFCLQPPGDSPTRKGFFDSLQAGCIPVVFGEDQAVKQYLFHLPGNGLSYSVIIPQDDVAVNHYDVMEHLSRIPRSRVRKMQDTIVKLLPRLLYRSPSLTGVYASKDAVDVAIDGLLERFQAQTSELGLRHLSS